MMLSRIAAITIAAVVSLGPGLAESDGAQSGFKLVVNVNNPTTTISKVELSKLYLATSPVWANGKKATPVDLAADSTVRDVFSNRIHGRNVPAVKSYWQKMIFSGRGAPPPELQAEGDVLRFLAANPSGVGYVSAETPLPNGIRIVQVH